MSDDFDEVGSDEELLRLTEAGEHRAVGLLGGQDIANVTAAFVQMLREYGTVLGKPDPNDPEASARFKELVDSPWTFFAIQRVVFALAESGLRKHSSWPDLVGKLEDEFLAETDYFSRAPRAFTGEDRGF